MPLSKTNNSALVQVYEGWANDCVKLQHIGSHMVHIWAALQLEEQLDWGLKHAL